MILAQTFSNYITILCSHIVSSKMDLIFFYFRFLLHFLLSLVSIGDEIYRFMVVDKKGQRKTQTNINRIHCNGNIWLAEATTDRIWFDFFKHLWVWIKKKSSSQSSRNFIRFFYVSFWSETVFFLCGFILFLVAFLFDQTS